MTHRESDSHPLLSVVVPSYNSQDYLARCLDHFLPLPADLEVIVVDDGSSDRTAEIAQDYVDRYPDNFRLVSKPNGGHGSAINSGLAIARGEYFRVVDSDDYLDPAAFRTFMNKARSFKGEQPDVIVTNFVYDKEGKRTHHAMRYSRVLPHDQTIGWDVVGKFGRSEYMLMHSLTYRTEILREIEFSLPEHTFYVDNLFAFTPLAAVRKLYYIDVDLYRYQIGRDDQSVAESVQAKRWDQQLRVNRLMIDALPGPEVELEKAQRRYLENYLGVVCAVSSIVCLRNGSQEAAAGKDDMWRHLRATHPRVYRCLRSSIMGRLVNLRGKVGHATTLACYRLVRRVFGFN